MSRLPLDNIIEKYNAINNEMATATETVDMIRLGKAMKQIGEQYEIARELKEIETTITDNQELLKEENDGELKSMLEDDVKSLQVRVPELEENLLMFLAPADDRDDNNILLEIRAGAGGDEASIFAGELVRSYSLMAQKLGYQFKIIDFSNGTVGGYKEVIIEIHGSGAFSWFKYEGGVHRVQRVPETEKQGRVHTSTISIAIMPIIEENNDFKLDLGDVEITTSTSQGAGGQSVNTTYSAIQVVHKPTGIRAQCQDERNQQQNKIKALQILTSRVFDHFEQIRLEKEYKERKDQVGTADRSEKIRTYNFPQDRVTDHRYNNNWNQIGTIMNGGIYNLIADIKKLAAQKVLDSL
jgi:peptide chain release factor 1